MYRNRHDMTVRDWFAGRAGTVPLRDLLTTTAAGVHRVLSRPAVLRTERRDLTSG